MRLGTMLSDVTRALFQEPVTEKYPFERTDAPLRYRGRLDWNPESCVGCQLCVKDCPSSALELVILDRKAKRFVLTYHMDRCTFCAQCVHSCRQGSISLCCDEWELAATSKEPFTLRFGDAEDVRLVLEGKTDADVAATAPE